MYLLYWRKSTADKNRDDASSIGKVNAPSGMSGKVAAMELDRHGTLLGESVQGAGTKFGVTVVYDGGRLRTYHA